MRGDKDIFIIGMTLDGFDVEVPEGLSELLNRVGAWKCYESDSTSTEQLEGYDRKVVNEDGRLKTYFTYKGT